MGDFPNIQAATNLPVETDAATFTDQQFDYVICGGGTAGLAIAARLSEQPDVTVGVIEAGANHIDDPAVDTPAIFAKMFGNKDYDWAFRTTPQRGHQKIKEHHMVRGKMLGGSSGINYMIYVRGSDKDYDDWADITEDESWASKNIKHYMRKHERMDPVDAKVTGRSTMPFVDDNHGTSGPIHTSFSPDILDIEDIIIEASDQVTGYTKRPTDPWSGQHLGFFHSLAAIGRTGAQKGKRSYAARGYLEEISDRPNLKVVTGALVTRVLLDRETATGVAFRCQGRNYQVKTKREVLVCGGAICSPQILELSGIGNPDILRAAGVEVKIENRAVGENFQDHVVLVASYEMAEGIFTLDHLAKPDILQAAVKELSEDQSGPLSCTSTMQGFFPFMLFSGEEEQRATIGSIEKIQDQTEYTKRQRATVIAQLKDPESANLQLVLIAASSNLEDGHADQSRLFTTPTDPSAPNVLAFAVSLQYPVSRGHVHITSADPEQQPEIDPGYLQHDADIDVLAAAMKYVDAVAKAPALKGKIGKRLHPSPARDLTVTEDCRQAVLDCYFGNYHPCGSVAMGDALDSRLKVKGTKNLRVADASSFPGHISGNIMSSVYMLAERTADIIKEDWKVVHGTDS